MYSPSGNTWATLAPLSAGIYGLSATSGPCHGNLIAQCVYAIGGEDSGFTPLAKVAVYGLSNTKNDQTISFSALPPKTYDVQPFTVSAAATSGLAVTFLSSGACTSGGTNGATVTINGAGTCTVTAHQAGNTIYNAAPAVPQSFSVAKADQTITFAPLAAKTYGAQPFTVSAAASSGLAVNFTASGSCTSGGASGATITMTSGGICTVTAHQPGDANYNPAGSSAHSFTVQPEKVNLRYTGPTAVRKGHKLTVSARLSTSASKPVVGVTVAFTLGKKPQVVESCRSLTSTLGVVHCVIPKMAGAVGSRSLTAAFSGTSSYRPATTTTSMKVTA